MSNYSKPEARWHCVFCKSPLTRPAKNKWWIAGSRHDEGLCYDCILAGMRTIMAGVEYAQDHLTELAAPEPEPDVTMCKETDINPNPPSRAAAGSAEPLPAEHMAELRRIRDVILSGWAGVLPNGNIVDRRTHPTAIPIPENNLFGTPPPNAKVSSGD